MQDVLTFRKKWPEFRSFQALSHCEKKENTFFCRVHSKTMQGIFCEMKNVSYDLELAKQVFCHYPNCLTEKLAPFTFCESFIFYKIIFLLASFKEYGPIFLRRFRLYVLSFMFRFMFVNICFQKNQNIKIHVMFITKHNMK